MGICLNTVAEVRTEYLIPSGSGCGTLWTRSNGGAWFWEGERKEWKSERGKSEDD
jgi:hypothetical protein